MESGINQYSPMDQSSIPLDNNQKGTTRDIVAKIISWGIFSGSRKALVTYVELKGNSHGGDRKSSEKVFNLISSDEPSTQKELAESYGITQQTMNNYMRMANMIPELQDLLETNIRQRGDVGGSAKKVGLRIRELERIYGIRDGSNNPHGINVGEKNSFTQSDIAQKLGMDVRTLQNYKMLADMIPELSDLVDTGIVTKTTALAIIFQTPTNILTMYIKSNNINI